MLGMNQMSFQSHEGLVINNNSETFIQYFNDHALK